MKQLHRWMWFGAPAIIGAGMFLATGPDARSEPPNAPGFSFLKVGSHYINLDNVTYAASEGDTVTVHFGSGPQSELKLSGGQANLMRAWLDIRSWKVLNAEPRLAVPEGPQARRQFGPNSDVR